jgi:hypothetical protein
LYILTTIFVTQSAKGKIIKSAEVQQKLKANKSAIGQKCRSSKVIK